MEECSEEEKLIKLRQLLQGAIRQINRKIKSIEKVMASLMQPEDITSETKMLCTILVEIKEVG